MFQSIGDLALRVVIVVFQSIGDLALRVVVKACASLHKPSLSLRDDSEANAQ